MAAQGSIVFVHSPLKMGRSIEHTKLRFPDAKPRSSVLWRILCAKVDDDDELIKPRVLQRVADDNAIKDDLAAIAARGD